MLILIEFVFECENCPDLIQNCCGLLTLGTKNKQDIIMTNITVCPYYSCKDWHLILINSIIQYSMVAHRLREQNGKHTVLLQ